LRKFTSGVETFELIARDMQKLFEGLDQRFPGLKQALSRENGKPLQFVNIYVNEEDVRFLGGAQYNFQEGDEILPLPPIAGWS
jgi:molybdopterin synthase sulfur carrier subunit